MIGTLDLISSEGKQSIYFGQDRIGVAAEVLIEVK
jgi:hypothetical protein